MASPSAPEPRPSFRAHRQLAYAAHGRRFVPMARANRSATTAQPTPAAELRLLSWRSRTQVFKESLNGLELSMVRIPAGSFLMGSQHQVTLAEFLIGATPITQAQWRAVAQWAPPSGHRWQRQLKTNPSRFQGKPDSDQRPVEQVNWHDAMEFCRRLNSMLGPASGRTYTLPSEAQWEYSCRAGTSTPFAFGETLTTDLANHDGNHAFANGPKGAYRQETTAVRTFPANAWGLYDMHGNVWEWCLDQWQADLQSVPADGSAWQGEEDREKATRLLRGGSWDFYPGYCRSACRSHSLPGNADDSVGLRVVCLPQGRSTSPLIP
jgi:formylglycine-generating enzyme required for sulfatase activity